MNELEMNVKKGQSLIANLVDGEHSGTDSLSAQFRSLIATAGRNRESLERSIAANKELKKYIKNIERSKNEVL